MDDDLVVGGRKIASRLIMGTGGAANLYRNFYLAVYQFGPTLPQQSTSIPPFLSAVVPAFCAPMQIKSGPAPGTDRSFSGSRCRAPLRFPIRQIFTRNSETTPWL